MKTERLKGIDLKAVESEYEIKTILEEMELSLIKNMKRNLSEHLDEEIAEEFDWPQWQALKLKNLGRFSEENREIFNSYAENLSKDTIKSLKKQYAEGKVKTAKEAIKANIIDSKDFRYGGSFFGINDKKLLALIKSAKVDMQDVKTATLRKMNDVYRSTIYKSQIFANAGVKTVQQAIDLATKDFLKKGIDCIQYKDKSYHNISDYVDMYIKTTNKRANLMGQGSMRSELGITTVYISKHGGSCGKCTPWEGKVYIDDVWSGGTEEDGDYKLLSTAISGGLFHPRCQHGVSTYIDGISNDADEIIEENENTDTQKLQRHKKEYKRLATGSIYSENVLNYESKVKELQNRIESSKIELTNDEQYAINQYISSDSYKINEALRNNISFSKIQREMVKNLDKALDKMPDYSGNIVRMMEIRDKKTLRKFINSNRIDEIQKWNEYLSFSNKTDYNSKANIEIWVKSNKAKDITKYNKEESEILYKRNSRFKTLAKQKIGDKYYILWEEIDE